MCFYAEVLTFVDKKPQKTKIMKSTRIFAIMAAVSLLMFSSCEDLLDVTKTFTFEHEFVVSSVTDQSFEEFAVIEMTEKESLINDYGSKIKKIEIEEVRYWLKAHDGSSTQTFSSIVLDVANHDGTDIKNIVNVQDLVLANLLNNPTVLSFNDQGIQKLSGLIKSPPHKFSLSLSGGVNEVPLNFTVVFEFKVKMVANPIN